MLSLDSEKGFGKRIAQSVRESRSKRMPRFE